MLRLLITILSVFAIIFGGIWFFSTIEAQQGTVEITYGGLIWNFSLIEATLFLLAGIVFVYAAVWVIRLVYTILRFGLGDETAINRFFARRTERVGIDALSQSVVAMASGDSKTAQRKAAKAERLLQKPELTRLLAAETAKASGDVDKAREYYRALAGEKRTAFIGLRGLTDQAINAGETDKALALAEKAHQLNPKDPGGLEALYLVQSQRFDWDGARATLKLQRRAGSLEATEADRREASLALAQAEDALRSEDNEKARDLAVQAARFDPGNTAAASLAARQLIEAGSRRAATKIVLDSWTQNPDTRLASVYAAIEPDEAPAARIHRFERMLEIHPDHPQTHFLKAELALGRQDWAGARAALAGLDESEPSARTCAIQAAITRGEGGPEQEVRAWLARALSAPRGGASDAVLSEAAMLPLMIGEENGPAVTSESGTDQHPDLTKGKGDGENQHAA